ncbi:hypothetical protein QQA_0481 [Clostridioides difficile Y343]|nr:hypothetical protein QQA_0481 [Clostridioides difficile Y343]
MINDTCKYNDLLFNLKYEKKYYKHIRILLDLWVYNLKNIKNNV